MAGAPKGNKNASAENRIWGSELRKVISQDKRKRLRKAAESLLTQASRGKMDAIKELGDRLDGKATQGISGPDGGAIVVRFDSIDEKA